MTPSHNHDELQRALGRIEGKLDLIVSRSDDCEKRLKSLEKSRNWLRGLVAATSVAAAAAWALLLKRI